MIGPSLALRITAIFGALAVGLGAFGAHALRETLAQHARIETWQTAVFYHLTHTLVMLAIALLPPGRFLRGPWTFFALGVIVFSGSLYLLCLTNITKLGMITPLGGALLIAGWVCMAISGSRTIEHPSRPLDE